MWDEGEGWRQRARIVIFVVAVCALIVGWWQHASDSRISLPILSSIDRFIGGTSVGTRAPAASAASTGTRSTTSNAPPTVGTSGRNVNGGSRGYSGPAVNGGGVSAGGASASGAPRSPFGGGSQARSRTAGPASSPASSRSSSSPDPCDPRTAARARGASDGQQTSADGAPCVTDASRRP